MPLTPKGKKIKAAMMKPKKQTEHRPFSDPLEKRWIIWGLNGEKIDIVADKAFQDNGILALYNKNGKVGVFKEFRAALQYAHGNFGFTQYWVNDGAMSHIVEANSHSWQNNGLTVFTQMDHETKAKRLVAVFPNTAWWVQRDNRL